MGKKRSRPEKTPTRVTYRYVTFTDENNQLQHAFEEVPVHGRTQNRTIPLGPVQGTATSDAYVIDDQEPASFDCDEELDETERLFASYAVQDVMKHRNLEPEQCAAVTRNYEVALPEPELHVECQVSDNSYLSDDRDYQVDLVAPKQEENEFVHQLPVGTKKIVSLKKESKQFLIYQLFGDVYYSEEDISDCDELKEAQHEVKQNKDGLTESDKREIEQTIAFFEADFDAQQGTAGLAQPQPEEEQESEESFEEEQSVSQFSDDRPRRQDVTQEDLNEPIGVRALDDKYMYYEEDEGELVIVRAQRQTTLEDRIRQAQEAPQGCEHIGQAQMICISKKTGKAIYRDSGDNEEQEGVYVCSVVLPHDRDRYETADERRTRKQAVKEAKALRRQAKEDVKRYIAEERQKIELSRRNNISNVYGALIY